MDALAQLAAQGDRRGDEMNRIIGLPRVPDVPDDIQQEMSDLLLLSSSTWKTLNKTQVAAMLAYLMYDGLLGAVGVGWGKTFISFKIADLAYAKGKRKILLLVPANCVVKTAHEIPELMEETALNLPIHIIGGQTKAKRSKLIQETSGLFIMSYAQLSLKDTSEMIKAISPEVIIADECHKLAKVDSSCTMRIDRYMNENPKTEFCGMSGTLTNKTLYDYAHLARWACRKNSPLPDNGHELDQWCDVLATTFSEHVMGVTFKPLIDWARANYPKEQFLNNEVASLRRAYKYRFTTTPGIVSSGDAKVNVSLMIQNNEITNAKSYQGYEELIQHMDNVNDYMMNPAGEEIEYALHKFKYMYELTSGFFLELYWEDDEVVSKHLNIPYHEAHERLERSKEHLEACQLYWAQQRKWLEEHAQEGLDMPSLLEDAMLEHQARYVGNELYTKFAYMKSKEFEGRIDRAERSHRVCDYKVQEAVKFYKPLKKLNKGCLFWVHHHEMGRWLVEAFKEAGMECIYADATKKGELQILNKNNKHLPIIASTASHGTGKNLQHFSENYFVQFSRSATTMEQAIGRTHRQGQKSDQLIMNTNFTTEFDHEMFSATIADSLYIAQTQNRQKLIYADYNPIPKQFSNAVLKERGLVDLGNVDKILKGL
jgi:hypothetical protein